MGACEKEKKKFKKNPYFAIDRESIRDSANNNNDDDRDTHIHIRTSEIDRDIDTTSLADTTYLFLGRERSNVYFGYCRR